MRNKNKNGGGSVAIFLLYFAVLYLLTTLCRFVTIMAMELKEIENKINEIMNEHNENVMDMKLLCTGLCVFNILIAMAIFSGCIVAVLGTAALPNYTTYVLCCVLGMIVDVIVAAAICTACIRQTSASIAQLGVECATELKPLLERRQSELYAKLNTVHYPESEVK